VAEKTFGKIIAAIIGLFIIFSFVWYFSLSDANVSITVKSGDGVSTVASVLKKNNLILSKKLFMVWARISKSENKIKPGIYEFTQRDGMFSILRTLKEGSKNVVKFTIPEGSNIKQTAEIIASKTGIDKDKFIKIASEQKLEGYLMPETYFVDPASKEEKIISIMRAEFDKKVTPEMYERAKEIGMSMEDVITLASIVEKEAVRPEERARIAGVFHNRLKKRIRLESCATVLYALGENKSRLTIEDTEINSPYNTYRRFGLPPGPIASPGIESIKAVLYPENTSSLFFVSAGAGRHLFADTLEEHIKNRNAVKKKNKDK